MVRSTARSSEGFATRGGHFGRRHQPQYGYTQPEEIKYSLNATDASSASRRWSSGLSPCGLPSALETWARSSNNAAWRRSPSQVRNASFAEVLGVSGAA